MNDMHDMTEQETAVAPDTLSRAPDDVTGAGKDVAKDDSKSHSTLKPTEIRILDPKIEHTKDAWHDLKASANNLFLTARYHSIRALPAAVVNNSTNILGITHVMTEMMMLKASGDQTPLIKNYKNPLRWVWDPLYTVFKGTLSASKIQKTDDPSLLPATGSAFEDRYKLIADTDLATKRELDRLEKKQLGDFKNRRFIELNKELEKQKKPVVKSQEDFANDRLTPEQTLVRVEVDKKIDFLSSEENKETIRKNYREKLAQGHTEFEPGKDKFRAQLTEELDGLSKVKRADRVKKYESELKEITGGTAYSQMRLSNPWQMRSTMAGLVVWALSAVWPDKKESDDEVERMAVLRSTNLPAYVGERFKQAVWVPEWTSHKRQMIGLGIMTSGVCSLLGSWRNRKTLLTDAEAIVELAAMAGKKGLLNEGGVVVAGNAKRLDELTSFAEKKQGARYEYEFNPSYFATSLLTFLSSLPLLFASDSERGFSGFGGLMTGRLLFLPSSIGKKFRDKEPGVGYYSAGMASFQAENWAQALAGGAQKVKDPKTGEFAIVDHDADRKSAAEKTAVIRAHKHPENTPSPKVTHVAQHEAAMPELVQMHAQQKSEVTV